MPSSKVTEDFHGPPSTLTAMPAIPETASVPVALKATGETYQPFKPNVPFTCRVTVGEDASYFQARFPEALRPEAEVAVNTAVPCPSGRFTTQDASQEMGPLPVLPEIVTAKPCGSEAFKISLAY